MDCFISARPEDLRVGLQDVSRESNWYKFPSYISADRSQAVSLLQFFVRASVVSYVAVVLSLFASGRLSLAIAWYLHICLYLQSARLYTCSSVSSSVRNIWSL